ncbi:unnamed protein product, partial [Ectocarpus sp. 13 AM-2016]
PQTVPRDEHIDRHIVVPKPRHVRQPWGAPKGEIPRRDGPRGYVHLPGLRGPTDQERQRGTGGGNGGGGGGAGGRVVGQREGRKRCNVESLRCPGASVHAPGARLDPPARLRPRDGVGLQGHGRGGGRDLADRLRPRHPASVVLLLLLLLLYLHSKPFRSPLSTF